MPVVHFVEVGYTCTPASVAVVLATRNWSDARTIDAPARLEVSNLRKLASALFEALRYGCVERGEFGYRVEVHVASDAGMVADPELVVMLGTTAVVEYIELGAGVLVAAEAKTSDATAMPATQPSVDRL